MSELKIGTRVECKAFGKGTVVEYIDTDTSYYIKVQFDNGKNVNCSKDGYIEFTKNCPPYTVKAITEECKTDKINPNYYKGNIECIEAIKASMTCEEYRGFLKGQVMKYTWRYREKGGVVDLQKAGWYLDKLVKEQSLDEVRHMLVNEK